jgi:hypothetical protein
MLFQTKSPRPDATDKTMNVTITPTASENDGMQFSLFNIGSELASP